MKDPMIQQLVLELRYSVNNVNVLMKQLQDLNVDVRIAYVEKALTKNIDQGITLWRVEEHNDYLD